jgi:serine/threonine protein kinase
MFLELCSGGDLHAWLNSQKMSSEPESRYIAYQLMLGLGVSVDRRESHETDNSTVFTFESNCSSR